MLCDDFNITNNLLKQNILKLQFLLCSPAVALLVQVASFHSWHSNNQKQPGEKCFGPTSVPGGNETANSLTQLASWAEMYVLVSELFQLPLTRKQLIWNISSLI